MGVIHADNKTVRANIDELIRLVQDTRLSGRVQRFSLHLNRNTGAWIAFLPTVSGDFIQIEVTLDLDQKQVVVSQTDGLTKTARFVVTETCSTIKNRLPSINDLKEIAHWTVAQRTDRAIIAEAWHAVSRAEAERLLRNQTEGTYLFRKDPFAASLEKLLIGAKGGKLLCMTLTYVGRGHQVFDKTVVQWNGQWMFYDDNPTLLGEHYSTFDALMTSMKQILKKPFNAVAASI